jgi:fluoride ion exporter CrcB/FEX
MVSSAFTATATRYLLSRISVAMFANSTAASVFSINGFGVLAIDFFLAIY